MSAITLNNVQKRFKDVQIIPNLNLEIKNGEFVVLVGPSGCGKSTTLRMIAGLEDISEGELWIGDTQANHLEPGDREVSMVFQSYALFPNMTVKDNLTFGMKVRKEPKHTIESEVSRIADMLNLTPYLNQKPKQLSGGQAQRVALGRALIRHPKAFLFDEPLSNLDAELRVHMRREISEIQRKLNVTTVYVTHDQTEAMTMGHRVAVMNAGELMQFADPITLYDDPNNEFVANFLGTPCINSFAVTKIDESYIALGKTLDLSAQWIDKLNQCQKIKLAVRPECITLSDHASSGALNAQIIQMEKLGHETIYYLQDVDSKQSIVSRVPSNDTQQFQINEFVHLTFDIKDGFFFDQDGLRIR